MRAPRLFLIMSLLVAAHLLGMRCDVARASEERGLGEALFGSHEQERQRQIADVLFSLPDNFSAIPSVAPETTLGLFLQNFSKRANARHPELAIKEKMAELLLRQNIDRSDIQYAARDYLESDYALLRDFEEEIDLPRPKEKLPHYTGDYYWLGELAEHEARAAAINAAMDALPPKEAAEAIFNLFPHAPDNPLSGLAPGEFLEVLHSAREAAAVFWGDLENSVGDSSPETMREKILQFWNRCPAASGALSLKRHPAWPTEWRGRGERDAADFQKMDADADAAEWQRLFDDLNDFIDRLRGGRLALPRHMHAELFQHGLSLEEANERASGDLRSAVDEHINRLKNGYHNSIVNLPNVEHLNQEAMAVFTEIFLRQTDELEDARKRLHHIIDRHAPNDSNRYMLAFLAARIYAPHVGTHIPAMRLLAHYRDYQNDLARMLERLGNDPDFSPQRLHSEVSACVKANPIAAWHFLFDRQDEKPWGFNADMRGGE